METFGLPLAIETAFNTNESRDRKEKEELRDFFKIAKYCIKMAASDARTCTDICFDTDYYKIIDIETNTTIKEVFEQQGYNVDIVRNTTKFNKKTSIIVKISWDW